MKINATKSVSFKANIMSPEQARYVDKELSKAKRVDIICHEKTDRDCAHSAAALWEYMDTKGINARIVISNDIPAALNIRNHNCNIIHSKDTQRLNSIQPDIAFCVDFGGESKISPEVKRHIDKAPKVMGFDHHKDIDIARGQYMQLARPILDSELIISRIPFYSDTTAKSTTSIIYRFFEALGEDLSNEQAYDLFFGFVDDASKSSLVRCNGEEGTIEVQKKLTQDKKAYEIYSKLKEKLTDEQIKAIAQNVSRNAKLNEEEKEYKAKLQDTLQFSPNGKIAYVEIPPDDKEWLDFEETSQNPYNVLNHIKRDALFEHEDTEAILIFHIRDGKYRISAHTRGANLFDFFKYVEDSGVKDIAKNAKGHIDRAHTGFDLDSGMTFSEATSKIISCDEFFEN